MVQYQSASLKMTLVHLLWLCVILLKITQTQAVLKNFEVNGKVYVVEDSETGPQSEAAAKCNEMNAELPSLKDSTKLENVISEMGMPRTKLDQKKMYCWIVDDDQVLGWYSGWCDVLKNFVDMGGKFDRRGNPYPEGSWNPSFSHFATRCSRTENAYTLCMCIEGLNDDETACKPTCDCSDDATCADGVCTCNEGFEGDGKTCTSSRPEEDLGDPDMYVIVTQEVKYSDAYKSCFENCQAELAAFFTEDQYKSFMDRINLDETKAYTPDVQSWPSTQFSYSHNEYCVRIHYLRNEWIWNDAPCGKNYFFICMKVDIIIGRYHYKLVAPQKLQQESAGYRQSM